MTKAMITLSERLLAPLKDLSMKFTTLLSAGVVSGCVGVAGCVSVAEQTEPGIVSAPETTTAATDTGSGGYTTTTQSAQQQQETEAYVPSLPSKWVVLSGDHLWGIAGIEQVYGNPEYWPLLYKANIHQIQDADLIFPGQVLDIARDSSAAQVDAAITHARNRGAWSLGEVEDSDRSYLSESP